MRLADRFRLALEALVRYPLRTGMMLLATGIGVAAVLILTSLGEGSRRFVTGEFQSLGSHLLITMPGRSETTGAGPAMFTGETPRDLTLEDARSLLRSQNIRRIAPLMLGALPVNYGGLERESTVIGTTADFMPIRNWNMSRGRFLPNVDMERAAAVCVLGHEVYEELFRGEPAVNRWVRVGDRRCRVTGVLAETGHSIGVNADKAILVPVALAQSLFDSPALFRIFVQARGRDSMERAKTDVISIITERHYGEEDITVISQDAVLETFDSLFDVLTMGLAGIASVSLVVAGVLIMNVMLVAVSQRTEEIGLFKALGAKQSEITALFLTEAAMLAGMGALAGLGLGFAITFAMGRFYPIMDFTPPLWAVFADVGIAVACGLVFGILPARRAARLDPVDALAGR